MHVYTVIEHHSLHTKKNVFRSAAFDISITLVRRTSAERGRQLLNIWVRIEMTGNKFTFLPSNQHDRKQMKSRGSHTYYEVCSHQGRRRHVSTGGLAQVDSLGRQTDRRTVIQILRIYVCLLRCLLACDVLGLQWTSDSSRYRCTTIPSTTFMTEKP